MLTLRYLGATAGAHRIGAGIIVHAESKAMAVTTPSCRSYTTALRSKLIGRGELVATADNDLLKFAVDVKFDSLSAAACVIAGSNVNGQDMWVGNEINVDSQPHDLDHVIARLRKRLEKEKRGSSRVSISRRDLQLLLDELLPTTEDKVVT